MKNVFEMTDEEFKAWMDAEDAYEKDRCPKCGRLPSVKCDKHPECPGHPDYKP